MKRMTAALLASTMMLGSIGAAAQPTNTSFIDMDGQTVKVAPSDLARQPLTNLVGATFEPVAPGTVLPEDYQHAPVIDRSGALVGRAMVVVAASNGELRRIVMDADPLLGYGGEVVDLDASEMRPVRTNDGTLMIQADTTQQALADRAVTPAAGPAGRDPGDPLLDPTSTDTMQ
ncbi:MAG: hypothetical protein RID91_03245 [Azospirillaceae bacterium]